MKAKIILSYCFILLFFNALLAQTVPPGFTVSNIASGWNQPVGTTFSSDGQKLFVWEKGGKLYVCNRDGSGNYQKQVTPVLDISEEVGDWRDHGMLGFTLDPNFSSTGYIYVSYVVDRHYLINFGTGSYNSLTNDYYSATIGRVTRYTTMTNAGNLVTNYSTRTILLGETKSTGIPVLHQSHGVGSLAFASDGTLLVSAGDGASYSETDSGSGTDTYFAQALADGIIRAEENVGAFRSQMLNSHCGKLLRIDPATGNGVGSNPFFSASAPRSAKSRVWALGFRNPFRFTIKPGTGSANPSTGDIGEIYVGDVGWGLWEELDVIDKPGMNCGWPLYEGHTPMEEVYIYDSYFRLKTPVNFDEPNPLYNGGSCTQQYFLFKSMLKQATADNIKTVYNPCNPSQAIGTGNRYFHRRPAVDWLHYINPNARVGIFNGNDAATAVVGTPESQVTGSAFNGNASVGGIWYTGTSFPAKYRNTYLHADYGAGWVKSFTMNFSDVLQKVENLASDFTAVVNVALNPLDGSIVCTDIGTGELKRIQYGGNYSPVVKITSNKTYGPSALSVNFTGNTSFDPDGTITGYLWDFGDNTTSASAAPSHTFTAPPNTPTKFVVKLTVTDNLNDQSTDSIIISVNNTPPVVNITSPVKNSTYKVGTDTLYANTATVIDAEHSPGQLKYAWQTFLRHNNHQHPEKIDTNKLTQTLISRIGCNGDDYYWLIVLTVTDAAGLSTRDSSKLFPLCTNGALPLVLRSFSVTQEEATENLVKWTTELEENIDYFVVERSTDGINFYPIYRQQARNIATATTYSYIDNNFPAGVNYYRLKIVEKGSVVRYSIIIKTSSENEKNRLSVMPNPVTDVFSISYLSLQRGVATIQIRDINGRSLHTIRENISKGNNVIYMRGLPGWQSGIYFITIQLGNNIQHGKFVKM